MSESNGRPALAVSLPDPEDVPRPAWLGDLLSGLVENGLVSAAEAVVASDRSIIAAASAGAAKGDSSGNAPLFDLASLTKLWTASLALRLDGGGQLPLTTELGAIWPACDSRLAKRTLGDLLRHRAGFQPWTPIYRRCRGRSTVPGLLTGGSLLGARRGTYSDLDFVLWGLSAERALGCTLSDLLRRELIEPMGLAAAAKRRAFWLPCRLDNEREVELAAAQGIRLARLGPPIAGRVQDGNARFLGAPAGHAGLFATTRAISALAQEWLAPGALWSAEANSAALAGRGSFRLGWRLATRRGSAGPALAAGSYGHLGFTGGSLWVDPQRRRVLVLLAHRCSVDVDLAPARRRFHALSLADGTAV